MKVGILKRGCANETHLGHSDPSKYFLDNLGNDRRISYYLGHYWLVMPFYYSNFIHCTNSDFLIG